MGRRSGAALIDLIPLVVLAVGLSSESADDGRFGGSGQSGVQINLEGVALLAFVGLAFVYAFVSELQGRSLGKVLLGLRVVDESGVDPSLGQVAKRTLARIVDGFPFLYLVGFVAAASDAENRRVGDRWAKARVVVDDDERPARWIVLPLVAAIAVATIGIVRIVTDPGEQVGAFDYDEEVEPFARDVAEAVLADDLDAVLDAFGSLQGELDGSFEEAMALFEDELGGATGIYDVVFEETGPYEVERRSFAAANVIFGTDPSPTPRQALSIILGDVDGELTLLHISVIYPN